MDVFRTDRIRNVVLLGHGGAGKTTLAEAMAYLAGMTSRLGRVEDGNTVSDYDKEEIKRHFSITTSLIPVPWDKMKVNVLDTPGYFDFVGEVEEAVSAADAAIIVVSGKAGVENRTLDFTFPVKLSKICTFVCASRPLKGAKKAASQNVKQPFRPYDRIRISLPCRPGGRAGHICATCPRPSPGCSSRPALCWPSLHPASHP